jgi:hypothetical protein
MAHPIVKLFFLLDRNLDVIFEAKIKRTNRRFQRTQIPNRELASAKGFTNAEYQWKQHSDAKKNPVNVIGIVKPQTRVDETATFTVFAPTDAAFAALGEDTILELLGDITTLADILAYHVIADQTVDANTAISLNGSDVEMLNGDTVSISVEGDVLYINDSAVIVADISAANGVIHIIDTVLSPPES